MDDLYTDQSLVWLKYIFSNNILRSRMAKIFYEKVHHSQYDEFATRDKLSEIFVIVEEVWRRELLPSGGRGMKAIAAEIVSDAAVKGRHEQRQPFHAIRLSLQSSQMNR